MNPSATTCILTDSTAQFPTPAFTGRDLVHMIPLSLEAPESVTLESGEVLKASHLPASVNGSVPRVEAPSVAAFQKIFSSLGKRYEQIIAILHSAQLTDTFAHAEEAVEALQAQGTIQVIDGQTTAIGLGLLVQAASKAAEQGMPAPDIDRHIRALVPRVYSIFCIEGLTYLEKSGYLGPAQAKIGEMLKVLPLYILDNGHLVPTQKARNYRHLVDLLHEFLNEFTELDHIALLQGAPPFETETRALRDRIAEDFPDTPVSEHTISATLASIIGPRSLGMFLMHENEV